MLIEKKLSTIIREKRQRRLNLVVDNTVKKNKTIPSDWVEFCSLLTIQSGNKFVAFHPYDFQIELYKAIKANSTTLVVKSRQMGFSQVVLSIILHEAILNPAFKALILSKNGNDTSLLAKRMREMINCLKEGGYIEMENDNLQHLSIKGGGKIFLLNSKPSAGRGIDSVSFILYDEAAFVDQMELTFSANEASQAMVGDEAKTVILSTPNGSAGWYYDKFITDNNEDALTTLEEIRKGLKPPVFQWIDNSGWCKFIAHWKAHPTYSKKTDYLENIAKKKKIPLSQVLQEYDLSFTESAERIFSPMLIKQVCSLDELSKTRVIGYDYYLTLDTNYQTGGDYLVSSVFRHDTINDIYEQIEMYRNRSQTQEYHLYQISELIDKYNPYIIGIEVTGGVGQMYLESLQSQYPQHRFKAIKTTSESKPLMISKLCLLMEMGKLALWNRQEVVKEFLSFQRKDGKLGAVSGAHDDIVMSTAFLTQLIPEFDRYKTGKIEGVRILN